MDGLDFTALLKPAAAGIPLVLVVMGVVEWFKSFKKADGSPLFSGNWLLLISMGWGLLIGSSWMVTQSRPPVGDWYTVYGYFFVVVFYGIAQGLVASGLYKVVKNLIKETFTEAVKNLITETLKGVVK